MFPDRFHVNKWTRGRLGFTAVFLLLTLFFLSGCLGLLQGNNEVDLAVSSPYTGLVELQCNQTCADRGQCGQAVDGTDRVFMNSGGPAVEQHDQLILPNSRGIIVNTITQTLQTEATGEQFSHPFHLVQIDGGVTGWVVEWCVVPVN